MVRSVSVMEAQLNAGRFTHQSVLWKHGLTLVDMVRSINVMEAQLNVSRHPHTSQCNGSTA